MARTSLGGSGGDWNSILEIVEEFGKNADKMRRNYMDVLREMSVRGDDEVKQQKLNEKRRKKLAKELAKDESARREADRRAERKGLLESWKEEAAFRKEQRMYDLENAIAGAQGFGAITKASFKYAGAILNEAAANFANKASAALMGSVDKYLGTYTQYMSDIETRIQGAYSGMTYESLNEVIRQNTAGSPFVKYTDVLANLSALVKEGVASNLTQRAFLATISDKIATTFNALDNNLLRLIRIQQQDTTASRLGMEAELTRLFNYYFSDTSYLGQAFDSVTSALTDLSAQLSASSSVELEYIVQKWLGSLGSVGVDESTLSTIAQAINALGSGQIDWLTGNASMQNLLVMAANRMNLSYSDMLVNGVNSNQINQLLYGIVDYIQDVTSGANNVVKAQYAELFGLTMADIAAFENLSEKTINSLYKSGMTYQDTLTSLSNQLGQVSDRIHVSEQIDNVIDNILAATGIGVANNTASYLTYKIANMVESLTGGIYIPTVSVLGSSITLPNSIEEYIKMGVVGISTVGSLFSAFSNWFGDSPAGLDLNKWTSSWDKGTFSGFTSVNELQTSTSSTGFVSNTNSKGLQQSIAEEQTQAAEETSGTAPSEGTELLEYVKAIKTFIEESSNGNKPLKVNIVQNTADTNKATAGNKQLTVDPIILLQSILARLMNMGTDEYPMVTVFDDNLINNSEFTLPEGVGWENL